MRAGDDYVPGRRSKVESPIAPYLRLWTFDLRLAGRLSPYLTSRPMLDNCPFRTLTHKDLTIEGYSRAAVQSYWRIPELKLGFDLGAQPWDFMGTQTWFISHVHLDHVAALPVYVARRRMMKMDPPVIYAPAYALDDPHRLRMVMQEL